MASRGGHPGMASGLETRSEKSRKKCPPEAPDPPRFPHGTDAKTLVTLGPEKNVNLAHTYTLVGGSGTLPPGPRERPVGEVRGPGSRVAIW
jgi:hypothetical protein